MVGRRRYQLHAGGGLAHPTDVIVNLVTGKLTALTGLGTLGHFDLQVGGVYQVIWGDAKPARSHLLDSAAAGIAVGVGGIAAVVLAAFAGVAASTHPVHGYAQGFMSFLTDGAQ